MCLHPLAYSLLNVLWYAIVLFFVYPYNSIFSTRPVPNSLVCFVLLWAVTVSYKVVISIDFSTIKRVRCYYLFRVWLQNRALNQWNEFCRFGGDELHVAHNELHGKYGIFYHLQRRI
jgi:hypothetical protein